MRDDANNDVDIVFMDLFDHVAAKYGPVAPNSFVEIVPDFPVVSVGLVPASDLHQSNTLFTIGMSAQPMKTPDDDESRRYQYAELIMELPQDWPLDSSHVTDPRFGWPIETLKQLARAPHLASTWLGGHATVFCNDQGDFIAPGTKFTGFFLFASDRFIRAVDSAIVQLYLVTPIYFEESELLQRDGIPALLRAFDRHSIPMIVDVNRVNVATE